MESKSMNYLSKTFIVSAFWDTFAGIMYLFFIGSGREIDQPETDPFYSVFLASFFFCFAYLQFLSAYNIRRYIFNVGCLIFGRLAYITLLYYSIIFVDGFPSTFWFTGIIDGLITLGYIYFAKKAGLKIRDLFLPVLD